MGRITEVVKHLLLINVIMFLATRLIMPNSWRVLAMFYPASDYFQPFQLVTHMFMHADIGHLAFNMLSLFFLGPWVEQRIGGRKFLIFYFVSAFGAALLHLAVRYYIVQMTGDVSTIDIPVLGASGAVYGVVIGFGYLFPEARLMLLIPPIPIKAKYLAVGLVVMDLVFGFSGTSSGVAHFAHVGGAVSGFLLIYYWMKTRAI
jgi:membrane associated rhomboid family serine protease